MTVATKAPRTASSHSSPSLSPIDEANIFEDSLFESPDNSDSDTTDTDSTLSDVEQCSPDFGHPLERMERTELSVGGLDLSLQEGTSKLGFDAHEVENIQRFVDAAAIGSMGTGLYSLTGQAYESPTRNSSTSNLSIRLNSYYFVTDSDFEKVVDLWASKHLNARQSIPTDMITFDASNSSSGYAFMTRCFHSNSAELSLYEEANKEGWRRDPWNPIPHILHSFNRDDARFLCMEQLMKYNEPPLLTLANYVDFFRQILEGLTFLHEKSIALGTCSDTRTFMVDLSSGRSNSKSSYPDLATTFDRSLLPVKYYFTDLSKAQKVRSGDALKRDVQDCAILFDVLLSDVWLPQVTTKFQNLTKSMLSGTFGADDSRKLLEAMCRSIDGRLFGAAVDGSSILSLRPSTGECRETESPHRQTMSLPMTPGTDDPGSFVNEPGSGRNQRVRHANSYPLPEPLCPC